MQQHKIQVSISWNSYSTKEDAEKAYPSKFNIQQAKEAGEEREWIQFYEVKVTAQELLWYVLHGKAITHVFSHPDTTYGFLLSTHQKKNENFLSADCLFLDIDDSPCPMDEYISRLPIKPTFAYHTFRNGFAGITKFRMVYVLTQSVTSVAEYAALYWGMRELVRTYIGDHHGLDDKMQSASQYINGTSPTEYNIQNARYFGVEYDPSTLPQGTPPPKRCSLKKAGAVCGIRLSKKVKKAALTDKIRNDFYEMGLKDFINKYRVFFKHDKFHSDNVEYDEELHAYIVKSDKRHPFAQLRYKYNQGNGRLKWKHGDHRSCKTYVVAITFHTIYGKKLTANHLLFLLAWYIHENYVIKDWTPKCTGGDWKRFVEDTVIKVIGNSLFQAESKKYFVDKSWCRLNGVEPKAHSKIVCQALHIREVMAVWDFNMGVSKNVAAIKKMGIDICERTVKNWRKKGLI